MYFIFFKKNKKLWERHIIKCVFFCHAINILSFYLVLYINIIYIYFQNLCRVVSIDNFGIVMNVKYVANKFVDKHVVKHKHRLRIGHFCIKICSTIQRTFQKNMLVLKLHFKNGSLQDNLELNCLSIDKFFIISLLASFKTKIVLIKLNKEQNKTVGSARQN